LNTFPHGAQVAAKVLSGLSNANDVTGFPSGNDINLLLKTVSSYYK